jgi:ubiquinone/menaquinone biosynthesis C-methylase UbiE
MYKWCDSLWTNKSAPDEVQTMSDIPTISLTPAADAVNFNAIKLKQQATWASGDYAVVGTTLVLMAELLCEAADLRSGWRVLDVAAGNGNSSLAAARRGCRVTSTDYVPALLERGRLRAEADGFRIDFQEADAENLPFDQDEFDAVLSTVGVMFAPNQAQAAAEMLRVVRPGGKIGLANWTPSGFVGQIFKCIGKYIPPAPGLKPPSAWGTEARLRELFGSHTKIEITPRNFIFRSHSPEKWLDIFKTYYGPMNKTFAALNEEGQAGLTADLLALVQTLNRADDGTMVLPSEYLEVVITK